jgi:hypothetical protein
MGVKGSMESFVMRSKQLVVSLLCGLTLLFIVIVTIKASHLHSGGNVDGPLALCSM